MTSTTRPRLLVLTSTFPRWADDPEPGFVFELSRRLTDRFTVTVLAPHAPGSKRTEELSGVRIRRFRYAPGRWEQLATYGGGILSRLRANPLNGLLLPPFLLSNLWTLVRMLRRHQFDVIHAHWLIPQGLLAVVAMSIARRRVPLVCTSHGGDLFGLTSAPLQAVMGAVMRRAEHVTMVSQGMREHVLALGADPARLSVAPMGVDLRRLFIPDPAVKRSENEILFVGRLVQKKGLEVLLNALQRLHHAYPALELTVVGDGPLRRQLQAQASALGLEDRVRFQGMLKQRELPTLFRRATLLAAPFIVADGGDQEGLGLVMVEAMGCDCPVVASDLPAIRDVITGCDIGTLAPTGNPDALAAIISELLANPKRRQAIAAEARNTCQRRFDWSIIAARYSTVLTDALAAPVSPGRT